MPSLNMSGPYEFTSAEVDKHITRTQAGNYALGYLSNQGKTFKVRYVGRSDTDVNDRLKKHLSEREARNYTHFKFRYATSPKDAFETECRNYHDFGEDKKLDNKNHPDIPSNSKNWKCPVCGISYKQQM